MTTEPEFKPPQVDDLLDVPKDSLEVVVDALGLIREAVDADSGDCPGSLAVELDAKLAEAQRNARIAVKRQGEKPA